MDFEIRSTSAEMESGARKINWDALAGRCRELGFFLKDFVDATEQMPESLIDVLKRPVLRYPRRIHQGFKRCARGPIDMGGIW